MNISEKSRKSMENLGLTSYEIKVYLSLLEKGSITASDISKKSGVPYSKIYEVLNSLDDKGWLEANNERPQKFFPKSPSTALENVRIEKEREIKENENQILNELMPIYEKSGIKEKPEIWVVRGFFNITNKVIELVQNCHDELLIALPQIAQEIAKSSQPLLRTIHDKGVKIQVLVPKQLNSETVRSLSRIASIKFKNNMFGGGVIGDGKQVILLLGEDRNESGILEPIAIWADHSGLAGLSKDYFNYLWNDSDSIQ